MLLEVEGLAFGYRPESPIFQDVSFTLDVGQTLSIIGPNGSGKSALLNCLAGLVHPTRGQIRIDGVAQSAFSARELARVVGYLPQEQRPAFGYTVRDFVVMGRAPHLRTLATPGKADYALADSVLDDLGLTPLAGRPYPEISGGERQQAGIARVLVQQPKLIMLDEPTSALDFGNQLRTVALLRDLADDGFAVVMTTHTPDQAILLDDQVALLDGAGHLSVGSVADVLREDRLREIYRADLRLLRIPELGRLACLADDPGFRSRHGL